jgi:hypothetical protein
MYLAGQVDEPQVQEPGLRLFILVAQHKYQSISPYEEQFTEAFGCMRSV